VEVLRVLRSRKKWSAAIVGVAVIGTFAAVALGSMGVGFTPANLVTANLANKVKVNSDRIKFQTKDPTDVRVQKIVIDPGGYSGWHHHPGIVIVTVASGAVTFTTFVPGGKHGDRHGDRHGSDCSSKTYGPGLPNGAVFVEGGDDPGQASSTTGATVYATFVAPHVNPPVGPVFRIEDAPPPCA
jgi:hypothetical protein